ncbi:hypothetical protein D0Z07_0168 [Hyphodiscus hymeniophilus]|uniref:Carboxylesterase family protein n=1 Tax=Hyphodiscus hymeniophilus TaxID=353542 RepID=A0A9P7B0A8_9HELO|nr:hypothetical protein D0Z07_0168 [Hyphodiscus hymeniophilus]
MARTTRSKKVEISEDDTAQTLGESCTGSQLQPLEGNAMSVKENMVDLELKNLKAAYRDAIGMPKKIRKAKNKQIVKESIQPEFEDSVSPHIQPPVARITRRQAKAQEGPYLLADALSHNSPEMFMKSELEGSSHVGRPRDAGYLMSLIAGTGPSRSLNASISGRNIKSRRAANNYLFLADAAVREAPNQENQNDADIRVTEVTLAAEPKELKENFRDQQTLPNTSKQVADPVEDTNHGVEQSGLDDLEQVNDQDGDQDSFVGQITSRSPAKPFTELRDSLPSKEAAMLYPSSPNPSSDLRGQDGTIQADEDGHDSFVEHISTRSPAKPRIEDSVEALDQMEEVEEALHEAAMAEIMVSPEKKRQKKEQPVKPGFQSMRVKSAPKRASVIKKATSMTFKPLESSNLKDLDRRKMHTCLDTTPREVHKSDQSPISQVSSKDLVRSTNPFPRPASLLPPKDPTRSTKPVTRPTNFELPGEAVARKLKEQREQRKAQRESSGNSPHTARAFPGPSVKSTKPLTKPNFELPGEALSRRKREAHEAKVKAEEEEERKRREFKAKPIRQNVTSSVRDTAASRARQSRIGLEGITDGSLTVSKRTSMDVNAHRPFLPAFANKMANTSAPRAPGPNMKPIPLERKPSTKFHGPSMSGLAMQRTVSATEVQIQRQRAKEIYNRDQKFAEDIEREKKEREAAAKRSREEAAERGRQASREWAEKQKAKKLAEGDKGMSAGYGPGGQMGLKA